MAAPAVAATSVSQLLRALVLATGLCACAAHAQEIPPPAYQLAAQRAASLDRALRRGLAGERSSTQRAHRPVAVVLNVAGQSRRFATRADACSGLQQAMRATPHTRIDAGLGQINLGYHKHRFTSACDLLGRIATSPSPLKS